MEFYLNDEQNYFFNSFGFFLYMLCGNKTPFIWESFESFGVIKWPV